MMKNNGYVDLLGSWEFVDFSGKRVGVYDFELRKSFRYHGKPCKYAMKFGLVNSSLLIEGLDGMDYVVPSWPGMVWDLFMNLSRKDLLYYYSRMVGKRKTVEKVCWIYDFKYFGKKGREIIFQDAIECLDSFIGERSVLHVMRLERYDPAVLKSCGFKRIEGTDYFVCGKLNGKNWYKFDVRLEK